MYQLFFDLFTDVGAETKYIEILTYTASLITIAVVCFVFKTVVKYFLIKTITKTAKMTKTKWDDILLKNKFFHHISNLTIIILFYIFAAGFPENGLLAKIINIMTVLIFTIIIDASINSVDEIYRGYEISKIKPIRGLLQIAKVVLYIIGGILIIAILIGENPLVFIGGIGAFTAVTSLIFKDAILGFVAGIQLSANDMLRIGDWIEIPKYFADGTVIDLSLTTVKVENFNRTITAVPAYALVSDAFINWRSMVNSGGRRIKRAIYIDASGVKLCDNEMLKRLRKIFLLENYMDAKQKEINIYNSSLNADLSVFVNGRRLTNIGTFRAYIIEYLKQHPGIQGETAMVRQLESSGDGIPLEIYAFANTVKWAEYEGIQADIFDHLYSIAQEFGLTVYQHPTGSDFRKIL
ncbi:MAG: mechanosensitive ion channel family protein [Eubacteriales bacterium]